VRVDFDILVRGDRRAAEEHANALHRSTEPLHPDDVEALLAMPDGWGHGRSRVATALLQHALRSDDPALVTRVRDLGPFSSLAFGGLPARCLRAALVGLDALSTLERFHRLRFWSTKVNVCDFSVVADVLADELGSRAEGTGRNKITPGSLAAEILLRSALIGRDPAALCAPLSGATNRPDRPTRERAALAALAGVEALREQFDAVRLLAVGRPARRAAVVTGIVTAVDVASTQFHRHGRQGHSGFPYAEAIAVADELAATPTTKKLVSAVRVRHQRGQLVGDLG
jgi:hypothetical protein